MTHNITVGVHVDSLIHSLVEFVVPNPMNAARIKSMILISCSLVSPVKILQHKNQLEIKVACFSLCTSLRSAVTLQCSQSEWSEDGHLSLCPHVRGDFLKTVSPFILKNISIHMKAQKSCQEHAKAMGGDVTAYNCIEMLASPITTIMGCWQWKKKVKHNFVSENLYPRKSFFKNLVFSDPELFLHVKKKGQNADIHVTVDRP